MQEISIFYSEGYTNEQMKLPPIVAKNWKKLACLLIAVIVIVSLGTWTALSPSVLSPQSETELSGSLFRYAKSTSTLNITDGEGSYSFIFGVDYNETVTPGVPSIILVFASLLNEEKSSGLLKGVALQINNAAVLIDGVEDTGVKSMVVSNGGILSDRLSGIDINDSSGVHQISARLIVSTVDVNYIGYFSGNEEVLSLNGTITIA